MGHFHHIPAFYSNERELLYPYKVLGVQDENKARTICALLFGDYEIMNNATFEESEYCEEIKEILNRGYFEVEYLDGVMKKRIEVPKDWKPKKYDHEEHALPCPVYSKWDNFKDWLADYCGALLGGLGFLLGICGLFLGLFL